LARRRTRGAGSSAHRPRAELFDLDGAQVVVFELRDHDVVPEALTAAEREIVRLLLAGRSAREIAAQRAVSYRTVANQLASSYRKLGVCSVQELLARVIGEH
jgi:DNA-binding CsgD family transcriptional regulator